MIFPIQVPLSMDSFSRRLGKQTFAKTSHSHAERERSAGLRLVFALVLDPMVSVVSKSTPDPL